MKTSDTLYTPHDGTIIISGKTDVNKSARYVAKMLEQPNCPAKIEITFIGANAGHTAFKVCEAITVLLQKGGTDAMFRPDRAKTMVDKRDPFSRVVTTDAEGNPVKGVSDMFFWTLTTQKKDANEVHPA